ncbi:hypothetical protein M501DRAFT_989163 [Patellaria atrata CBS 101060]|uniref:Uncharacterized protein n=1 Tax=Patellaria atrata CBS 101060 TaxID=1346257 RepID=A0A9P4VP76_9PEZI|nr:hypothetical protein M501DRAFT_989163 [Patellaria atrata CBS 101060]
MSFEFSASDLLALLKLVNETTRIFHNTKGAKSEYQELVRDLKCLKPILNEVQTLNAEDGEILDRQLAFISTLTVISKRAESSYHQLETQLEAQGLTIQETKSTVARVIDIIDNISTGPMKTFLEMFKGLRSSLPYRLSKRDSHTSDHPLP